jgi:hypothetical protein
MIDARQISPSPNARTHALIGGKLRQKRRHDSSAAVAHRKQFPQESHRARKDIDLKILKLFGNMEWIINQVIHIYSFLESI